MTTTNNRSNWFIRDLTLPITTRGIGVNLCLYYSRSVFYSKTELPNIHSVYRAILGIVEEKFARNFPFPNRPDDHTYEYYCWRLHDVICLPKPLHSIVEAIGLVKYKNVGYYPAMSKNTVIDGNFVPRPENILLSNLRDTVLALSDKNDSEAALSYRKSFYRYNSVPAARWDLQNYTILNPDEIIPDGYDSGSLSRDLINLTKLRLMVMRYDKDYHIIDLRNRDGKLSSLMCNEMDVRTPDLKTENLINYYREAIPEYCNRSKDLFYSPIPLWTNQSRCGATLLLGELPDKDILCPHHSFYILRSENNILLEESKLTIAQRQKSALKLRDDKERREDSELLIKIPVVRPRTSRRRSLSTIRESGVFDIDGYRPLKRGEDREKLKERLANTMAYGNDQQQSPPIFLEKKKQQHILPTAKQKWNELVTQIRERTEWLAEMEYLGQAAPHRDIIKDQIAERMRALDALGIDSECSTPKSTASGFSTKTPQPLDLKSHRSTSTVVSRISMNAKKKQFTQNSRSRNKEENVTAYSQLSPLQYSPRRRQ